VFSTRAYAFCGGRKDNKEKNMGINNIIEMTFRYFLKFDSPNHLIYYFMLLAGQSKYVNTAGFPLRFAS
jgi:hypothetical protein